MEYLTTANVLTWVFLTLAFFLMFVSYWIASAALFPRHTERCSQAFSRPVVATLLGLFAGGVPLGLGIAGTNLLPPALKWIGIFVFAAPIFLGLVGSAGLAWRIGSGMHSEFDGTQPWRRVLRGGTVLALTFLLPVLGQLLIPLILAAGVGASVLAAFRQERAPATPPAIPSTNTLS